MRRLAIRLAAVIMILAATLVASIGAGDLLPASATGSIDFGIAGAAEIATFIGLPITPVATPTPTPVVHLYLGLTSDRAALEARARAVSDPASPEYGRHGTVAQEGAAWNAMPQTITTVSDWFATRSVSLTLDPTSSYFEADVPLPVAEEAFGQVYGTYSLGSAVPPDVVLLTPILAPTSVAPGLVGFVDRVYGAVELFDTTTNLPMAVTDTASKSPATHQVSPHTPFPLQPAGGGTPWRTGTASDACAGADAVSADGRPMGLSPGQLRTAYGIDELWNLGFRGRGARIAVVDENLYDPNDLAAYRSCFGVEGTAVTPHLIGSPVFGPETDETTLDLEVMTAIAPEADRIDWFAVDTTSSPLATARPLFDMLVAPLDASMTGSVNPDVISSSFGMCEEFFGQTDPGFAPISNLLDQALATAVASGVGVFVASFDDGSSGCYRFLPPPAQFAAAVAWPSTSRWVTAVGGTNLTLDQDNHIGSSGVWNDHTLGQVTVPPSGEVGGGGGGVSTLYSRPWYQAGNGVPGGAQRLVPDIAAFADVYPGYLIHLAGQWEFIGGTSAATPLTAGAFALQSSAARAQGRPGLGFVNPLLYSLARTCSGDSSHVLFDITIGTNDVWDIGVYPATPGFDLATGLGSVMHGALERMLDPRPARVVVPVFTG